MGPDRSDERPDTGTLMKRTATALRPAIAALSLAAVLAIAPAAAGGAELPADGDGSRWRTRPFADRRAAVPADEVLIANGATIGEIYVRTDDIFDPEQPGEDGFLFQLANRLHVTTRPAVVEQKLLFQPGDPYDPRLLQETARYLRSQEYLYDARIEPLRYRGNRVDILVTTRDVWTLSGGAGFERSGGENTFQMNLRESNFLGTGRFLDVKYIDDPDRSSSRFRFVDVGLFGSRAELRLWYASNSDGHRRIFDLERPFYALDSRWAGGTKLMSDQRLEKTYHQGEVSRRFYHERTFAEIRGGLSKGYSEGRARRWQWGYTYERNRFWDESQGPDRPEIFPYDPLPFPFPVPYFPGDKGLSPPPPQERELSYLWLGVEEVEDRYIETRNMDQLQRTEDFNLGTEYRARLGFSSEALGGDQDQTVFAADVKSGFAPRSGHTMFVSGYAAGRWGSAGHENVQVGGELRYFLRDFGRHQLLATVRADAAWNLDPENQLLLGGDNGLRGYPFRFQDGDRRFQISLEQRFYTDWELFKLIHVGAAIFFDAGRAWYDSGLQAGRDQGLLKDLGLGLRLSSSRSSDGQMVHLDVAFPLDGDTDKVQWLVTSKKSF